MMIRRLGCVMVVLYAGSVLAQPRPSDADAPPLAMRFGISAGMGVGYIDATDVVNVVNQDVISSERVAQFHAGVEFFGSALIPVSEDYGVKLDYGYLLFSYSGTTLYGVPGEFTVTAHLPSLVFQYVLVDERYYDVKIGAGGGYHFGRFIRNIGLGDEHYSASGPGFLFDVEGSSALGEHLFAHLGANLRWEAMGSLTNTSGAGPVVTVGKPATTLHFFSLGARIGLSYYF